MNFLRVGFLGLTFCVLWTSAQFVFGDCAQKDGISQHGIQHRSDSSKFDVYACPTVVSLQNDFQKRQTQDEMLLDAVVYLQKSIIALKKEKSPQSFNRRITPILTVISGLLDAGFAPEEPIICSATEFLEKFYTDLKQRRSTDENLSSDERILLSRIRKYLKRIHSPTLLWEKRPEQSGQILLQKHSSPQVQCRQLNKKPAENQQIVSCGVAGFVRVRDKFQPSVQSSLQTDGFERDISRWSDFRFRFLIASVHALDKYFPLAPAPQKPRNSNPIFVFELAVRTNENRNSYFVFLFILDYLEIPQTHCFSNGDFVAENLRSDERLTDLRTTRRRE